jgi:hypothetical protein
MTEPATPCVFGGSCQNSWPRNDTGTGSTHSERCAARSSSVMWQPPSSRQKRANSRASGPS